jgi:hypothetical protein
VALHQLGDPRRTRVVGRAVVEEERPPRHPGAERDNRRDDPAEVGHPEQELAVALIEVVGDLGRDLERKASVGVHGSLRHSGRA